jgi:hypothetical protein
MLPGKLPDVVDADLATFGWRRRKRAFWIYVTKEYIRDRREDVSML